MTVLDLMAWARGNGLRIEQRGQGAGRRSSRRSTRSATRGPPGGPQLDLYVNGKEGEESAGVTRLKPRDRVLWKYTSEH